MVDNELDCKIKELAAKANEWPSVDQSMLSTLRDNYTCILKDIPEDTINRELIATTLAKGMHAVIHIFENVERYHEQQFNRNTGQLSYPENWESIADKFFKGVNS
mgnify:CR=1 FL=1